MSEFVKFNLHTNLDENAAKGADRWDLHLPHDTTLDAKKMADYWDLHQVHDLNAVQFSTYNTD